MVADHGYDDHALYELSMNMGFQLVYVQYIDTEIHLRKGWI